MSFPILEAPSDSLRITVRAGRKEWPAVIDTGASITMLHAKSLLKDLAEPIKARTVLSNGRLLPATEVELADWSIGEFRFDRSRLARMNLPMLEEICGLEVAMIVGMDSLENIPLQIDFDRGVLTLGAFPKDPPNRIWKPVEVKFQTDGRPYVEAAAGETEIEFLLDSGATTDVRLTDSRFGELESAGQLRRVGAAGMGGNVGILRNLSFAGSNRAPATCLSGSSHESLGMRFLRRFNWRIAEGKVWLSERTKTYDPGIHDRSGMGILKIDGRVTVKRLKAGGAAESAGIRMNDVIGTVDGRDASEFTLYGIREQFRQKAASTIRLGIERSGEIKPIAVDLEFPEWRMPAPGAGN